MSAAGIAVRTEARTICIVDAYGTGAELAETFARLGHRLVHVQSAAEIPACFAPSFRPHLFEANLIAGPDPAQTATALRGWDTTIVIAGAEPGTALADALAAALELPGNPPATSRWRRDKFAMGEAVRTAGLAAVRQAVVDDVAAAIDVVRSWKLWPIVVKPVSSAGSDNVRFCRGEEDVARAVDAILGTSDRLGQINDRVLLQERMFGQQFIVNAISRRGRHHVVEIWRDDRLAVEGAGTIYDREVLLPPAGPIQDRLCAYARAVLDAVGVVEGPSHGEFMLREDGPVLIEIGARLQGGICPPALVAALGDSLITHTVRYCLDPAGFEDSVRGGYRILKNIMVVNLIAHRSGILVQNRCAELFETLPSYFATMRSPRVGDRICRTVDLWTKPGHVFLVHEDLEQLDLDYRTIRAWEAEDRLFKVEADTFGEVA